MKKDHGLYLLAAACGAAVWILVAAVSGRREAWDSGLYFTVGIPLVCLIAMAFAFLEPHRPWRWGVTPLAGQFVWMLLTQGAGNLLPLGVVMFGALSLPSILTARFGASLAVRRARGHER